MRFDALSDPFASLHDVLLAAPRLLGATLVHGELRARIVETEAYRGADDAGCHAFYGRTPRTEIMFGEPGRAYVYFTYGNHWMLNVVAHGAEDAAAVLIRAAVPLAGIETMRLRRGLSHAERNLLSGPGKLAQAFGIDRRHYGIDLFCARSELRIEWLPEPVANVLVGPRIGLSPGKGDDLPWRFIEGEYLEWVSATKRGLRPL